MSSPSDTLRDLFHEEGLRLTPQRRLVLRVLQSSDRHLDAEALYARVRAEDPDISLATVYRTLRVLKEIGLVEEHSLGEGHSHYEAPRESPHYHFVCTRCGHVLEFDSPYVELATAELEERHGLRVESAHLRLSGLCRSCQASSRSLDPHA